MADILPFADANGGGDEPPVPDFYPLAELPQRASIAHQAFGCGWPDLDALIKFYPGQFIVTTGISHSGKSTLWLNVIARLAMGRRLKSFLYVPENEAHLREKMKLLWPGADHQFEHFCASQCFVQSAVPHDIREPGHDILWVLDRAAAAVQRAGVELVFIDPWNELEYARGRNELMTDYIGRSLMTVKQFCRSMNAIVIIAAHPTKAVFGEKGTVRTPGLADIEHSMHWFNKCDNGLIVTRDSGKNSATVISAKVREIGGGKIGQCSFSVDPATGRFKPFEGSQVDVLV